MCYFFLLILLQYLNKMIYRLFRTICTVDLKLISHYASSSIIKSVICFPNAAANFLIVAACGFLICCFSSKLT
nr:MAG TPA: hypothetical protein [Caudoviricetes sp.]